MAVPDQYSKEELAQRLRTALHELDKIADEIILTYLKTDKEDK